MWAAVLAFRISKNLISLPVMGESKILYLHNYRIIHTTLNPILSKGVKVSNQTLVRIVKQHSDGTLGDEELLKYGEAMKMANKENLTLVPSEKSEGIFVLQLKSTASDEKTETQSSKSDKFRKTKLVSLHEKTQEHERKLKLSPVEMWLAKGHPVEIQLYGPNDWANEMVSMLKTEAQSLKATSKVEQHGKKTIVRLFMN